MGKGASKLTVRRKTKRDELVLALTASVVDSILDGKQRWIPDSRTYGSLKGAVKEHGVFIPRSFAETTTQFRQIIPYVVFTTGGVAPMWFVTKRLDGQTEERLRGMYSLGVGGHVNDVSEDRLDEGDLLEYEIRRELSEELEGDIPDPADLNFVALLDDRDVPVSQHHLGIVLEAKLKDGEIVRINANERDQHEGRWMDPSTMRTMKFENWSELIYFKHVLK